MKALVRYEDKAGSWRVEDRELPVPGPGEVLIRVAYAGICGSDLHMYRGVFIVPGQFVSGHEFSGTVAQLGEGVSGFEPGEQVTVEHTYCTCGSCRVCLRGDYQLCSSRESIGFDHDGAFAEYVVVNPRYIHRLPEGVALSWGALTEPLACAVHAVRMVRPEPSDRVLVVGPGPIGLLTAMVFKAYNARVDIVGTPNDGLRLETARTLGLAVVDSPGEEAYSIVAECSGSAGGMNAALKAVEKGGAYLQVGIAGKPVTIDFDQPLYKELKMFGTYCHRYEDWEIALDLMARGLVNVEPLISRTVPLEDWEQALEDLEAQKAIKVLIGFGGEVHEKS